MFSQTVPCLVMKFSRLGVWLVTAVNAQLKGALLCAVDVVFKHDLHVPWNTSTSEGLQNRRLSLVLWCAKTFKNSWPCELTVQTCELTVQTCELTVQTCELTVQTTSCILGPIYLSDDCTIMTVTVIVLSHHNDAWSLCYHTIMMHHHCVITL